MKFWPLNDSIPIKPISEKFEMPQQRQNTYVCCQNDLWSMSYNSKIELQTTAVCLLEVSDMFEQLRNCHCFIDEVLQSI